MIQPSRGAADLSAEVAARLLLQNRSTRVFMFGDRQA
jgi:hypothetical protein